MLNGSTISELLFDLYEISEQWDFHHHALEILDRYIPASISGYAFTPLNTGSLVRMETRDHNGIDPPSNDELSTLLAGHPFILQYCSNRLGPVITTLDILSEQEWKGSTLYNELYRPHGMIYDTSLRFYSGSTCISYTFTDCVLMTADHRRLLNLVAPHLGNAHQSHILQQQGLLSSLPENVVLFSNDGRAKECPAEAGRLLRTYYPNEQQCLPFGIPDAVQRWIRYEILDFPSSHANSSGHKLTVEGEQGMLMLSLMRHATGFLLLLEETPPVNPLEGMMELGLTMREAEVLQWVSQGKQNSEIAIILGIRTATVRKHVENILRKFHCETRGAAALHAMQAQQRPQGLA